MYRRAGEFWRIFQYPSSRLSLLFGLIQPATMTVWLSDQHIDVSLNLGNILKRLRNLGYNDESDKYVSDERVAFDLVFGELRHYLMTLELGPQNCGCIVHSGITQLIPPQNTGTIQVVKNLSQLVGLEGENIFLWEPLAPQNADPHISIN